MNPLTQLLTSIQKVSEDCLRYIKLKNNRKEDPKNSGVLSEYYGELETIAQNISNIFDTKNDVSLVANSELVSGVGKIVEFFSSISNDDIIQEKDVEELNIPAMISMAQNQPQK